MYFLRPQGISSQVMCCKYSFVALGTSQLCENLANFAGSIAHLFEWTYAWSSTAMSGSESREYTLVCRPCINWGNIFFLIQSLIHTWTWWSPFWCKTPTLCCTFRCILWLLAILDNESEMCLNCSNMASLKTIQTWHKLHLLWQQFLLQVMQCVNDLLQPCLPFQLPFNMVWHLSLHTLVRRKLGMISGFMTTFIFIIWLTTWVHWVWAVVGEFIIWQIMDDMGKWLPSSCIYDIARCVFGCCVLRCWLIQLLDKHILHQASRSGDCCCPYHESVITSCFMHKFTHDVFAFSLNCFWSQAFFLLLSCVWVDWPLYPSDCTF